MRGNHSVMLMENGKVPVPKVPRETLLAQLQAERKRLVAIEGHVVEIRERIRALEEEAED